MRQRALIDLDCILDTRLAVIKSFDESVGDELAKTRAYRERTRDNFEELTHGKITQAAYTAAYAARDVDILSLARMSDIMLYLRKLSDQAAVQIGRGVEMQTFEVTLNLYPYQLEEGTAEMIRRAVADSLNPIAQVTTAYLPTKDLPPETIKTGFDMYLTYDQEVWIQTHQRELIEHCRIPLFTLTCPMISRTEVEPGPTEAIRDPFSGYEMIMAEFVAIEFLPAGWFCESTRYLMKSSGETSS